MRFSQSVTKYYFLAASALLSFAGSAAFAQCPTTAFCNPTNPQGTNLSFGVGIRNVTLGTLNNTTLANATNGTQNGYQDFSCTLGTSLTAAVSYLISITTGQNATENVRVYLDLNNDGVFSVASELIFSSNNALVHSGSINLPATGVTNVPLRMRVVSEFTGASALPSPCMNLEYGQAEDYAVTLLANTAPAQPDFFSIETYTCDGVVAFSDSSQNGPTSWSWDFGDPGSGAANFSTQQNPVHTFSTPGIYSVTLTACNANGCNTIVKSNYINFNTSLPVAAACTPITMSYCCGYGIANVQLAGINHSSGDGIFGYEDFTCPIRTELVEGITYPISITTSSGNNQNTGVWIDFNNDGAFSAAENVFTALNTTSPSGTVSVPLGAAVNTPLRMRVVSDFAGGSISACANLQNGQAEDYTITVIPNTFPPVAGFTIAPFAVCDTTRQFINTTQLNQSSLPTTYSWFFGDGQTSTAANPTHAYPGSAGNYTVTLIACNAFGCDTTSIPNSVTINNPCLNYCIPTNNDNTFQWISRVEYAAIDNSSGAGPNGYTDFSTLSTTVVQGTPYNFTVSLGTPEQRGVSIWIDYNRNGVFDTAERVFNGQSQILPSGFRGVQGSITLPVNAQTGFARMRVVIRPGGVNNNPCISNAGLTDVEDYGILIQNPPPVIPAPHFASIQSGICTGLVSFLDQSQNLPTSWAWNFGDGSPIDSTQNPSHIYQTTSAASYTVTLTTCNAAGCSTLVMPDHVVITVPCTIPYCASSGHTNTTQHIANVAAAALQNSSGAAPNGYSDFTNLSTELLIGTTTPITVQLASNAQPWYISVWIDLNRNAVFDTNERLFFGQSLNLGGGVYGRTGVMTIPASTQTGPTRMRVIGLQGTTNTDPCAMNLASAEVEDYVVNLVTTATNNVAIVGINAPVSGCSLSATSQVCVRIRNSGTATQQNIPVQFTIGQFQSPVELVPGPVAAGDTVSYCFAATANLAVPGGYTLTAQTSLTGDIQASNNSQSVQVFSYPQPNAGFTYAANGLTYTFSNATTAGATYSWNFGDGGTASSANPTHNFPSAGTYTVSLTVTSVNGCQTTTTQTLSGVSGLEESAWQCDLYPNPTSGKVTILYPESTEASVEILNPLGVVIRNERAIQSGNALDLSGLAKGIYIVKIKLEEKVFVKRLKIE